MAKRARVATATSATTIAVDGLTEKQAKAEHARLETEIKGHDRRYYQDDAPAVSDAEYDALRARYTRSRCAFPTCARSRACR